jgi:hypothetical protein
MSESVQQPESQIFGGGEPPAKAVVKAPSLMEQLTGIFTDPVELFRKLHDTPVWGGAFALIVAAILVLIIAWGMRVDVDAMLRPQMEQNPQMTTAQIDQAVDFMSKFMVPLTLVMAVIGAAFGTVFTALLYWLVGMIFAEEGKPSFLQALSGTVVSGLVGIPYALSISIMCFLRNVGGLSPEKLSPTSVGYYFHPDHPKLYALLCQIDLFLIAGYVMVYLAARHTLRLKPAGAAICTGIAVATALVFKVPFAK